MQKVIKSIDRTGDAFHPAVGYQYLIIFTDNSVALTNDDELIEQFGDPKHWDLRGVVGREFETEAEPELEQEMGAGDDYPVIDMSTKDSPRVLYNCPACNQPTSYQGAGVCLRCEEQGVWIDPAGGLHSGDEDDPAAMYE